MNLSTQSVESNTRLGPHIHGAADSSEILAIEKLVRGDEGVKQEIKKLQLPDDSVVICEPWPYGNSLSLRSYIFDVLMRYRI